MKRKGLSKGGLFFWACLIGGAIYAGIYKLVTGHFPNDLVYVFWGVIGVSILVDAEQYFSDIVDDTAEMKREIQRLAKEIEALKQPIETLNWKLDAFKTEFDGFAQKPADREELNAMTCLLEDLKEELTVLTERKQPEQQKGAESRKLDQYRASAERGERWGQHNLGLTYYNKDNAQAAFWFRKAAEQGDDECQFYLADILQGGQGVPPDHLEAIRLYKSVADGNETFSASAEYKLGNIYVSGNGVSRDYGEAVRYWKRAAEHGYELASLELGRLYRKGAEGFPNDFVESYFWLYVAVAAKETERISEYWIEDRDEMARRLDPESRRRVQERAHLWLSGRWSGAYQ